MPPRDLPEDSQARRPGNGGGPSRNPLDPESGSEIEDDDEEDEEEDDLVVPPDPVAEARSLAIAAEHAALMAED